MYLWRMLQHITCWVKLNWTVMFYLVWSSWFVLVRTLWEDLQCRTNNCTETTRIGGSRPDSLPRPFQVQLCSPTVHKNAARLNVVNSPQIKMLIIFQNGERDFKGERSCASSVWLELLSARNTCIMGGETHTWCPGAWLLSYAGTCLTGHGFTRNLCLKVKWNTGSETRDSGTGNNLHYLCLTVTIREAMMLQLLPVILLQCFHVRNMIFSI